MLISVFAFYLKINNWPEWLSIAKTFFFLICSSVLNCENFWGVLSLICWIRHISDTCFIFYFSAVVWPFLPVMMKNLKCVSIDWVEFLLAVWTSKGRYIVPSYGNIFSKLLEAFFPFKYSKLGFATRTYSPLSPPPRPPNHTEDAHASWALSWETFCLGVPIWICITPCGLYKGC